MTFSWTRTCPGLKTSGATSDCPGSPLVVIRKARSISGRGSCCAAVASAENSSLVNMEQPPVEPVEKVREEEPDQPGNDQSLQDGHQEAHGITGKSAGLASRTSRRSTASTACTRHPARCR